MICSSATALQQLGPAGVRSSVMADLIDDLHLSPRLPQWKPVNDKDIDAPIYRIWSQNDAVSVTVTPERIYMTKGIREFPIQEGLPAAALHTAIQTAQEIVAPALTLPSEKEEDEYFADDPTATCADLDSALAEAPQQAMSEEDAELIEEVTTPEPEAALSALEAELKVEDDVKKTFTEAANVAARKDTKLTQLEYADPPVTLYVQPVKDHMNWYIADRIKSLQGRVLTIMDASPIADREQREAVKSLIKKEFRRELNNFVDTKKRVSEE
jgi:hypothetical protein